jgi:tetratricopeptide (TPR) repeat protein
VTEALARARDAVRLAPDRAATHFNLGLAYEAAGDHTAAADAYRTAIERATPAEQTGTRVALARESLARAEVNSGIALLRSGRPDEAALRLVRALAQSPQSVEGRFALGLAFEQRRQFAEAVAEFKMVVAQAPAHVEAQRHLGRALHTIGRREEAVQAYGAALAIDPAAGDTHNDLGVALAELGRLREAEPHFAEAVRLNPGDAQAQANLVRTRRQIARGGRGGGR